VSPADAPLGRLALVIAVAAVTIAQCPGPVGAAESGRVHAARDAPPASVSSDWAGYAVTSPGTTFTSVRATWTQPRVACGALDARAESAFWVGLGGYTGGSQILEQVGANSDCSARGEPVYRAWYELAPSAAVELSLKVTAGDVLSASVNAIDAGTTIELQLIDHSSGKRVTRLVRYAKADLSSAEWIAEAPSECAHDACTAQPLANFGSITFTKIAALGNGHGGAAGDPAWTTERIELEPGDSYSGALPGPDSFDGSPDATAGATPRGLSPSGNSFSVSWVADAATG